MTLRPLYVPVDECTVEEDSARASMREQAGLDVATYPTDMLTRIIFELRWENRGLQRELHRVIGVPQ